MVRRNENLSFGAAYAFPGGVLEADDNAVHANCVGRTEADTCRQLGIDGGALDYYSAAIRELFEETGVLLATSTGLDQELDAVRRGLNQATLGWADVVARFELRLRCDELHYFSHWITPPQRERRYSTRFFLAKVPDGQSPLHCGGELIDSRWTTASAMLTSMRVGDVVMHFPTIKTLESIARHKSLDELIDWAGQQH